MSEEACNEVENVEVMFEKLNGAWSGERIHRDMTGSAVYKLIIQLTPDQVAVLDSILAECEGVSI